MPLGKYRIKLALFTLFIICFQSHSEAQNPEPQAKYTYTIGGNVFQGFIIKHSENMGHLAQSHPSGFEIFINQNSYGPKLWQQRYNFPDIGFSFSYFDPKNEILGKQVAATTYMDFNFRRRRSSDIIFKIGTGLVYTTNPYHSIRNNRNNALSSPISYVMQGRLGYNLRITDQLKFTSAISLTHFSNGGFKIPNSGINIVTYNLGFSQLIDKKRPDYTYLTEKPLFDRNVGYNVTLSSGLKGLHNVEGRYFPFLNVSLYADKRLNDRSALNAGMDGFYNLALKYEVRNFDNDLNSEPDFKRAGIVVGHELFMGKLSVLTQFGAYVYRPFKSDVPVYQRYGLKYYFKDNYFASLMLKSHGGRADNIEWGIGVRI
ncbi:hypothetical protein BH23BAC1_BH23BAC1_35800 [soil metagenome]